METDEAAAAAPKETPPPAAAPAPKLEDLVCVNITCLVYS